MLPACDIKDKESARVQEIREGTEHAVKCFSIGNMVHRIQKGNENIHRSEKIQLRHILKEPQDLLVFACVDPRLIEHLGRIIQSDRVVASLGEFTGNQSRSAAEVAKQKLSAVTVTLGFTIALGDPVNKVRPLRRIQILLEAIVISC